MKSLHPPGLYRLICYLTAGLFLLPTTPARGDGPPPTVMRTGAPAPFDGVLLPGKRAAQCVADAERLTACEARLGAEVDARAIADGACDETAARMELAIADETQAARVAAVPEVVTDWSAIGWGVVAGVVAGVIGAVVVAYAVR